MKVLVICTAILSVALAAPTYSQDGPFDHFTEVFDDNIAMPTAPEPVASEPSGIRFLPEHRETAAPIAAAQPIRAVASQPTRMVAPISAKTYYYSNRQPFRQYFNPYNNYPVNPFYTSYQNPQFFFKDNQHLLYQPQGPYSPYQLQQQPFQPVFAVPLRQAPSFGVGPSSPGVTVIYIPGFRRPVKPVIQSAVTPDATLDGSETKYTKKEEPAVEAKFGGEESPVEFEQGSLQEEDLFVTNAKEAVDTEADSVTSFEGSGSGSDAEIANDEKENPRPISLLTFNGSKSANRKEDAKVVVAATEEEIGEFEGLSVRNPFPDKKEVFTSNAKDNEVLMQMILGGLPSKS